MHKRNLTTTEAEYIISIVEEILIERKLPYGYLLSDLQGYSRLDVSNAFLLSVAELCLEMEVVDSTNTDFNEYVKAAGTATLSIVSQGFPDEEYIKLLDKTDRLALHRLAIKWSLLNPNDLDKQEGNQPLDALRKEFSKKETTSSFAEFCIHLPKDDRNSYWAKVYDRLHLELTTYEKVEQKSNNTGCFAFFVIIFVCSIFLVL